MGNFEIITVKSKVISMEFEYKSGDVLHSVSIEKKEGTYILNVGEDTITISLRQLLSNFMSLDIDGKTTKIYFARSDGKIYIFINGHQYEIVDIYRESQSNVSKEHLLVGDESEICAPMPGKVLKLFVKEGDEIEVKQKLVIVEAMKMENSINASRKGKVKRINFKEGDLVDTGQPIIELEE
jgi:biotin carboxyl carrier protein